MSLIKDGIQGNLVSDMLWRGDEKAFIKNVLSDADVLHCLEVVDVGGGGGSYSASLCVTPRGHLTVVDKELPSNMVKDVQFIQGDIRNLPFRDNTFDLVFARSVVHHVPNDVGVAVSELHRITKKGGKCIVSEPLNTPWGRTLRRIKSTYHDPDEHPLLYDELMDALCTVFPCGSGKGFGVFTPWLSFLSMYIWIPTRFIKLMYHLDRWLIKQGFYTMVYQMVWVMEK